MGWTKERLVDVAQRRLEGRKLIVVSNREPYSHQFKNAAVEVIRAVGGLTAALDPVMQACGGTWIAHGSGSADRDFSDADGRLAVPPEAPSYTLRRVWLQAEEERGHYAGFSNSTLWPLCHQVYQRPTFDPEHWRMYRHVNELFAERVLDEAAGGPALVFIQDYHFALLPRMLKERRPDLLTAQFWHIPWPGAEVFGICPWAAEILDGMLGNDLLGFHIQNDCNNFMECVDRMLESRISREHFSVQCRGQETRVRPFPISVDPALARQYLGRDPDARVAAFRAKHGLADLPLLVGVDRVDYTKGIPERLRGLHRMLEQYPGMAGTFQFVQVGAPSRTQLSAYRDLNTEVRTWVDRINGRFGTDAWLPVAFVNESCGPREVHTLYRAATGCVVSSLHDGMNLVAKEFVSARDDELGSLVLSQFTGAARELTEAIIVNPFDVQQMADGLRASLTMPAVEQQRRMRRLRARVEEHTIYKWAGRLISEAAKLAPDDPAEEAEPAEEASVVFGRRRANFDRMDVSAV
ncbi:MAG: trehalose-6-phosphate synthase [Gemmataceae bacterium]